MDIVPLLPLGKGRKLGLRVVISKTGRAPNEGITTPSTVILNLRGNFGFFRSEVRLDLIASERPKTLGPRQNNLAN